MLTFKNSVQLSGFLGCNKSTVGVYAKNGKLYNGKYYIETHPVFNRKVSHAKGILYDLHGANNSYICSYESRKELARFLKCDPTTVTSYAKSVKLFKGVYYIKKKE